MAISEQAKSVIERPLDPKRIKSRDGGRGMTFDYIGTEHAIQLLNEAFDYAWDSRVVEHEIHDGLATVLVELKVWDDSGCPIIKQQFGSCNINRGVDIGAALKGASSDGLKKCASQMGLALELYLDEVPAAGFTAPARSAAPTAPPSAPPARPAAPATPAAPPARPAAPPARPAPPSAAPAPRPSAPPAPSAPSAPPARPPVPGTATASVPRPTAPPTPAAPPAAPPVAAAAASRPNPFENSASGKGINTTQMSALTSLASKKGVSQPDLIALVSDIADDSGAPKQTFEELTHAEAIQVIKAAQLK